ncbi:MATE family efflux transporter [Aeromonas veronii]|uniref:MATE family efflux transporter n=1 Tax=Aeromonas veronii TaxID=654 RepID=UPI003B9E93ED
MKKIPNHIFVAGSSWIARFISVTVQIFCIRYVIDAQGYNGYSVFALLSSLLAWAVLFDFGIGNALQNYVSEKRTSGEEYYSYILFSGKLVLILLLLILIFLLPLSSILSSWYLKSSDYLSVDEKWSLFSYSISIFAFSSVGSMVYKIWFAEQKGWQANIVIAISSLLGLLLVYLSSVTPEYNSLQVIIIAFYLPQAIISFACLLYRLVDAAIELQKSRKVVSHFNIKPVLYRSSGFWGFTAIATVVLQADAIVLSQKISSNEIALYYIMAKLFGLAGFIYSALLQAVWPVCTELRMKREWGKLNALVKVNILVGSLFVLVSGIGIYIFKDYLLSMLSVKIENNISPWLFLLFTVYFILRVWSDTYAMLLQSMNVLRPLWYIVPFQALICLSMQWFLADYFGIYGIILGLIMSFLLTVCIYLPYVYKQKLKEISHV